MTECLHGIDTTYSRCDLCETGRKEPLAEAVPAVGPVFAAKHPGICGHCEQRFDRNTDVCAALVDGARVWAIAEHTVRG